jgi:hypothetical protein
MQKGHTKELGRKSPKEIPVKIQEELNPSQYYLD